MDFFYRPDRRDFRITLQHEEVIRNLNFEIREDGYYYDCQPVWSLSNKLPSGVSFDDIHKAMQFISMTGDIDGDIPKHFKSLLRSSYIEYDDTNGNESIVLGYKRPFGNSNVLGDVRVELIHAGFYKDMIEEDLEESDDYSVEEEELKKFVNFLTKDFFKNFTLKYKSFLFKPREYGTDLDSQWSDKLDRVHSYLWNWKLDPSEIRDEKIDKILN